MNASEPEPVVGWRLWRIREADLVSWAVDYVWQPGENNAVCLTKEHPPCPRSPGKRCRCGFWALHSPTAAMGLAPANPPDRAVMGLINGFGTVALHGTEGFRAEMATVACMFADDIAPAPVERLWRGLQRRFRPTPDPGNPITDSIPDANDALKSVAGHYGVPVVFLRSALALGLLSELGVGPDAIDELHSWLGAKP